MTEAKWKVTNKRHDGISRPAADFTVSHEGTFVAAFANEQDATDAARAVNARDGLVAAADAALTWWHSKPGNFSNNEPEWVQMCRDAAALAKGRAE